ncbi:hypothetical protein [Candidatus Fokinia crypta]|uniref:Uncharacterized protein n=1 Tax=Candidatus Fokinia crypta TaxID=1920990 RepID=A0ABZ0UV19_9RICK|nr:hypothetical protein [Candidatus Fokinia cryptica]WPX97925.1 hypothetical protein Fokcrypt_00449 [Candidatus Fokinia cryptica]
MFSGKILKFVIFFTLYSYATCFADINICVIDGEDISVKLADFIELSAKKNTLNKNKVMEKYNVVHLKSKIELKKRDDCSLFIGSENENTSVYTNKNMLYLEKLLIIKYDDSIAFNIDGLKEANILYNSEEVVDNLTLSNIQYGTVTRVTTHNALERVCKKSGEIALIMLNIPLRELQKVFRTCSLTIVDYNSSNDAAYQTLDGGTFVNNPFSRKVLSHPVYMFAKDKKLADYIMSIIKTNGSIGEYMRNMYSIELSSGTF